MCTVQTVLKFSLVQSSQDNMWATSGHALPEIQNSTCKLQTCSLRPGENTPTGNSTDLKI